MNSYILESREGKTKYRVEGHWNKDIFGLMGLFLLIINYERLQQFAF